MGNTHPLKLTKLVLSRIKLLHERSTMRILLSVQAGEKFKLFGSQFSSNISSYYTIRVSGGYPTDLFD